LVLGFGLVLVAAIIGLYAFVNFSARAYTVDQALIVAENYLRSLNVPDLTISELMEFEQNFYVIYSEQSTGIGAFEMLIDKVNGRIFPEYGPNMMWNSEYGHGGMMGGWSTPPSHQMTINQSTAVAIAQGFLDSAYPGSLADDPHPFYGYYTLHVTTNGHISGMLSVHGDDGTTWYHNWHGAYIQSRELH
jgi:hypothetical protein